MTINGTLLRELVGLLMEVELMTVHGIESGGIKFAIHRATFSLYVGH